jgi:hypothetical protein
VTVAMIPAQMKTSSAAMHRDAHTGRLFGFVYFGA